MKPARNFLLLLLLVLNLSSCIIAYDARTTQIEIMKPGVITIPDHMDTVAIINRNSYIPDTIPFRYFNGINIESDTTIKYKALSNVCVDALAGFLKKEGYFKKVINYRDSLASVQSSTPEELFQKTKSDLCISLDYVDFGIVALKGFNDFAINTVFLRWTIAIKTDTLSYFYNQADTLLYDATDFPLNTDRQEKIRRLANNSAEYLGRTFGSKIIPTWIPVERLYYQSSNPDMLQAEKFALNNEWLKAAEIWNKQTKNKNKNIAAKASYNMALACEMEGKLDVAIDWLIQSYSILKQNNEDHQANCQRYITILVQRRKEIQKLGKQVRN